MTSTHTIHNVAKIARIRAGHVKPRLYLQFPNTDYNVGGRIKSYAPWRRLKPTFNKDGTVTVQFNGIIWKVNAEAITLRDSEGRSMRTKSNRRHKAVIYFTPEFLRYV